MKTKTGHIMSPSIRARLIEVLTTPEHDGLTQIEVAKFVGVTERTVRNYLTAEVWDEIRKIRLAVMARSLAIVDRALFAKAAGGDIQAAKLIYSRWDEHKDELPNNRPWGEEMKELDMEIATLEKEIKNLESLSTHQTQADTATQA